MKEVKLSIPSEWCDITIVTYQEYVKIQESKGSEKNKVIRSLALLCNVSPFIIKKMAYVDLLEIMNIIKTMIDAEPKKEDLKTVSEQSQDELKPITTTAVTSPMSDE